MATLLGQMRQAGPWIWGEQTLYVGYTALALALVGLLIRRPRHLTPDGNAPPRTVDTRWIATGICLVVVGFVLAKGFVSSQQVRLPLFHLSEVPGLDFLKGLRATQRFSLLLYFGIMILSGAGAATLAARCRSARAAWIAISLACLVFLAEVYPIRLPFEPRPYEISRLDVAIPHLWRDETRAPVVVHLPIHHFLRAYATPEAVYMLDSTHHWARVVNGFSGASPHGFRQNDGSAPCPAGESGRGRAGGAGGRPGRHPPIRTSRPPPSTRSVLRGGALGHGLSTSAMNTSCGLTRRPFRTGAVFSSTGKVGMRSSSGRTARPLGGGLPATAWSLSRIPEATRA